MHTCVPSCMYTCVCLIVCTYLYVCMCVPNCMYTCVYDRDRETVELAPSELGCSSRTQTARPKLDRLSPQTSTQPGPGPAPCGPGGHTPLRPYHLEVRMDATRPHHPHPDASSPRCQRKPRLGGLKAGSRPAPCPCGPPFSHLSSEGDAHRAPRGWWYPHTPRAGGVGKGGEACLAQVR